MNIPSKNNNQSSVPVKVPSNKTSNQFFNSDTVKDHVSTNNKDVGIPKPKKNVDIPQKMDVNIPQTKDMDITCKNNNQSSVPVKVPFNKVSNQFLDNETVKDHVSTNNKDVGIPNKKDVDIPPRHTSK